MSLQASAETCLNQEACLPQEAQQLEQHEEEEEEEYEVEQADIFREAASLDDMAKRITVEEVSCCVDNKRKVVSHELNSLGISGHSVIDLHQCF